MNQDNHSPGPNLHKAQARSGLVLALIVVITALGAYAYFVSDAQIEARAPNTAEPTVALPVAVAP